MKKIDEGHWLTFREVVEPKDPGELLRLNSTGHTGLAKFARNGDSLAIVEIPTDMATGKLERLARAHLGRTKRLLAKNKALPILAPQENQKNGFEKMLEQAEGIVVKDWANDEWIITPKGCDVDMNAEASGDGLLLSYEVGAVPAQFEFEEVLYDYVLRVNYRLRCARVGIRNSNIAFFSLVPFDELLEFAIESVLTGIRLFAREIRALSDPRIARMYAERR